jgi:hypothetical protein
MAGVSAVSATDLGIANRRGETLVAETLVAGRGVCKEELSGGHDADPLVVKVGRHTPQHCAGLSRAKRQGRAE